MGKFMNGKAKFAKWIENIGKKRCLIEIDDNGVKKREYRYYEVKNEGEVLKALAPNETLVLYSGKISGN